MYFPLQILIFSCYFFISTTFYEKFFFRIFSLISSIDWYNCYLEVRRNKQKIYVNSSNFEEVILNLSFGHTPLPYSICLWNTVNNIQPVLCKPYSLLRITVVYINVLQLVSDFIYKIIYHVIHCYDIYFVLYCSFIISNNHVIKPTKVCK